MPSLLTSRQGLLVDAAALHVSVIENSKALLELFDQQSKEKEALLARIAELEGLIGLPISDEPAQHVGMHASRYRNSPLEAQMGMLWAEKQKNGHLLSYLLGSEGRQGFVSQRDATVAATVIQWLATDVGVNFLLELKEPPKARFLQQRD